MEQVGRSLVIVGVVTTLVGLFFMVGRRLPLDFHFQRNNFSFYFPLGTSILISLVLTLVFSLLNRK